MLNVNNNRSFVADTNDGHDSDSAIMASLDPIAIQDGDHPAAASVDAMARSQMSNGGGSNHSNSQQHLPDVLASDLQSLNLHAESGDEDNSPSFLLLDDRERLCVESAHQFTTKLGLNPKEGETLKAKVISIIGNTGEGKSYSLNHALFEGRPVFSTSPNQESGTLGAWAALQPCLAAKATPLVVLDTEGMLGSSKNENQRTRLLMKVLAASDVVLFRTRAERLHNDLFYFLGDASKAFNDHFSEELKRVYSTHEHNNINNGCSSNNSLGPTVIVCHQTRYTDVLPSSSRSAESFLRDRLSSLNQDVSAFAKLKYLGFKSDAEDNSDEYHRKLKEQVLLEIEDTSVRSPRQISLIFKTLEGLTDKFSSALTPTDHRSFPDEYFTCMARCTSCESRCERPINHEAGIHHTSSTCVYQRKLDNKIYLCLRCYHNGRRVVVVPKASAANDGTFLGLATFAWSGHVLECPTCGVIFRSREHWYGNEAPETRSVVHTEISHIWPGIRTLQGTHNAARRLLDGVNVFTDTVSNISAGPSKTLTGWMADQIAPDYWRPNGDITNCHGCNSRFSPTSGSKIHHCRACGEGFCDKCSDHKRPVPDRGWGLEPVRVCKRCYQDYNHLTTASTDSSFGPPSNHNGDQGGNNKDIHVRKVGEKVVGTLNTLATSVMDYPISVLKDSARPGYWVPDEEITNCRKCERDFDGKAVKLHHCRECGHGVCDLCSRTRRPVPLKGWDHPVRVCDICCQSQS